MQVNSLEVVKSSGASHYEYLTFEILDGVEPIIAVDQEKGVNTLEAEVFGTYKGYGSGVKVPLDDLIDALIKVRNEIKRLR